MNDDGNIVVCAGEPGEDGVDSIECVDSETDSMDGWSIEDGSWEQDEPEDDEGSPTWEDQMDALEEAYDATFEDYNDIYYVCTLDGTDGECDSGPKLVKKDGDSDAHEKCFANIFGTVSLGLVLSAIL